MTVARGTIFHMFSAPTGPQEAAGVIAQAHPSAAIAGDTEYGAV
jgi:hypothetical protein